MLELLLSKREEVVQEEVVQEEVVQEEVQEEVQTVLEELLMQT